MPGAKRWRCRLDETPDLSTDQAPLRLRRLMSGRGECVLLSSRQSRKVRSLKVQPPFQERGARTRQILVVRGHRSCPLQTEFDCDCDFWICPEDVPNRSPASSSSISVLRAAEEKSEERGVTVSTSITARHETIPGSELMHLPCRPLVIPCSSTGNMSIRSK